MDGGNYIYDAYSRPWHSPKRVLISVLRIYKTFGDVVNYAGDFKRVREGKAVALMLLGHFVDNQAAYFMQYCTENSPDYVTVRQKERENKYIMGEFVEVEVVEYGEQTSQPLGEFLINSKLDPKKSGKSYDDKTTILCDITRHTEIPSYQALHDELAVINPKPQVFLTGHNANEGLYKLMGIWPNVAVVPFNLNDVLRAYPPPNNVLFSKSTAEIIKFTPYSGDSPSDLEVFGLDAKVLEKKYNLKLTS